MELDRKKEILKCFEGAGKNITTLIFKLVDEMLFLEDELEKLKKYPQLKVHPENSLKQEITPAAKLYKDFVSRYTDVVGKLCGILKNIEEQEDSPLRAYLKNNNY